MPRRQLNRDRTAQRVSVDDNVRRSVVLFTQQPLPGCLRVFIHAGLGREGPRTLAESAVVGNQHIHAVAAEPGSMRCIVSHIAVVAVQIQQRLHPRGMCQFRYRRYPPRRELSVAVPNWNAYRLELRPMIRRRIRDSLHGNEDQVGCVAIDQRSTRQITKQHGTDCPERDPLPPYRCSGHHESEYRTGSSHSQKTLTMTFSDPYPPLLSTSTSIVRSLKWSISSCRLSGLIWLRSKGIPRSRMA